MITAPLLLVAGGGSSRMGEPKGLLDFHGEPWVEVQLRRFRERGGEDAVVVLGYGAAEYFRRLPWLQAAFKGLQAVNGLKVRPALNEVPKHGPFSSIQAGIRSLLDRRSGAYVLPVDVPVPAPQVFAALEKARRPETEVLIPTHEGKGGHPVWLSERFLSQLLGVRPSSRMARLDRQIAILPPESVSRVAVGDPDVLFNFNTPEQYRVYLTTH
ncbi:MAG: NTP transferase domain-containing protein [Bdellovibrionales bacterium]|nr:NTP transferase domain-containing protein [Bdellovibrionales bacterium]